MNSTSRPSIIHYCPTCSSFQLSYNFFFDEFRHFEIDVSHNSDACFVFESHTMRSHFFISISFSGTINSVIITISSFFICVTRLVNLSGVHCVKRCFNGFDHPLFFRFTRICAIRMFTYVA